jgi:hypothetical protein
MDRTDQTTNFTITVVKDRAGKVGGTEQLSDIVDTLKQTKK